jgi:hypothetical protein
MVTRYTSGMYRTFCRYGPRSVLVMLHEHCRLSALAQRMVSNTHALLHMRSSNANTFAFDARQHNMLQRAGMHCLGMVPMVLRMP